MSEVTTRSALPLFFKSVVPLEIDRHAGLRFNPMADANFARNTNSVPLGLSEVTVAAQHYPVIFTPEENPVPVAILGYRDAENLFLDENGRWVSGAYVPAYVRAYPFMLIEDPDRKVSALAADFESPSLGTDQGDHLFKMGKPTELVQNIFNFCQALRDDLRRAAVFGAGVRDAKLLEPTQANLKFKSGEEASVTGFQLINGKKFEESNDKAFSSLRKNGWIAPIYAQLFSGARWDRVMELAEKARQQPARTLN